eukprot:3562228-Rhodomonas_salina.1
MATCNVHVDSDFHFQVQVEAGPVLAHVDLSHVAAGSLSPGWSRSRALFQPLEIQPPSHFMECKTKGMIAF